MALQEKVENLEKKPQVVWELCNFKVSESPPDSYPWGWSNLGHFVQAILCHKQMHSFKIWLELQ